LIFLTQPTQADVLGDIGNAITGGLSAVGNAITGGVESVLGFGSQGLVGPILSGALDPVIGKFSDAVQKAGTNVVDYATGKFGDLADKEISKLDAVAGNRLSQLDDILGKTINQAQALVDKDLRELDRISQNLLNQEAEIITEALHHENDILNRSLNEVDAILDRTLSRAEALETDTFRRVEVALLDQAPAAGRVIVNQIVYGAIAIVFLVVFVGYGGVLLLRRAAKRTKPGSMARRLATTFDFLPDQFVTVAIPMLVITGLILGGYYGWGALIEQRRQVHLAEVAIALEEAGNFGAAASIRKRLAALNPKDTRAQFWADRDQWLADFMAPQSMSIGNSRLASMLGWRTSKCRNFAEDDPELVAVALYLAERALRTTDPRDAGTSAATPRVAASVDEYLRKYKDPRIVMRRLVYISKIRFILDADSKPVETRVQDAVALASELVNQYGSFTPARVLRAQLNQMRVDADFYRVRSDDKLEDVKKSIDDDVNSIGFYDPGMLKLVRLAYVRFTEEERSIVAAAMVARQAAKSEGKANPGPDKNTEDALEKAAARIIEQAQGALGSTGLARRQAYRVIPLLALRTFYEQELNEKVQAARKALTGDPQIAEAACITAAKAAVVAQQFIVAQDWEHKAKEFVADKTRSPKEEIGIIQVKSHED
jgi:hypothetical protein